MSQTMSLPRSAAAKHQLEIVSGLHSGVNLALEDGDYAIGCKSEADIVLRDQGVAPQHVVICIDGNDIRAEAVGGDLRIDAHEIAAGQGYRMRLPAVLTIGDTTLRLSRNAAGPGIAERFPFAAQLFERFPLAAKLFHERPTILAAGGLGIVFGLILIIYALQASGRETRSEYAMTNNSLVATASLPSGAADERIGAARTALENKLRAAGIDTISVAPAGGAHLSAKGRIEAGRSSEWTAIQSWFDQTYAPNVVLTAAIAFDPHAERPALRVQAIYYGQRPYIIAENGIRYFQGAIMDNGWVLQTIGERHITLKKDDQALNLDF